MYVCMYGFLYMYVCECMYVCMYVCLSVCLYPRWFGQLEWHIWLDPVFILKRCFCSTDVIFRKLLSSLCAHRANVLQGLLFFSKRFCKRPANLLRIHQECHALVNFASSPCCISAVRNKLEKTVLQKDLQLHQGPARASVCRKRPGC
jgi:hypothetical protein